MNVSCYIDIAICFVIAIFFILNLRHNEYLYKSSCQDNYHSISTIRMKNFENSAEIIRLEGKINMLKNELDRVNKEISNAQIHAFIGL